MQPYQCMHHLLFVIVIINGHFHPDVCDILWKWQFECKWHGGSLSRHVSAFKTADDVSLKTLTMCHSNSNLPTPSWWVKSPKALMFEYLEWKMTNNATWSNTRCQICTEVYVGVTWLLSRWFVQESNQGVNELQPRYQHWRETRNIGKGRLPSWHPLRWERLKKLFKNKKLWGFEDFHHEITFR